MQVALLPVAVLAVVAVVYARRALTRRRLARANVSGGRKALALNLERSRW